MPELRTRSTMTPAQTTTRGEGVAMFTLLTNGDRSQLVDLNDVLRIGRADDPVYVATHGWMLVGDLRWDMTPEWQHPATRT